MNLTTISAISKKFELSTRTLRYYEQIGLLKSTKKDGYAYRTYDDDTILRLQQIVILRKLRIPLKQIAMILGNENTAEIIETFRENLNEINEEITALSTIKSILRTFITKLNENTNLNIKSDLLDDIAVLDIVDSLAVPKLPLKEKKTLEDLNQASVKMNQLSGRDVRIVYLPPATVAAYQYAGDDPEMHVHQVMDKFVRDSNLVSIKPDLRHYGFNSPDPDPTGFHGYEVWVTIPDEWEVPEPIIKKHFQGGMYAAYAIPFGAFEEWGRLSDWAGNNPEYEWDMTTSKGPENMYGAIEEHLNYIHHVLLENTEPEGTQLDLLIPVKKKEGK